MGEPEEQQQLQNWKIKIIFLCRRKLYEPLHPGEYNWISSLVGSLGTMECELGYMFLGVQTMGTTWQAAREKINFLPNNRSSRRRHPASSLVSGGWVVVRKSYSEMKWKYHQPRTEENSAREEPRSESMCKKAWKQMQPVINCMPGWIRN